MISFKQNNISKGALALPNLFLASLILILIFSNIFFASRYLKLQKQDSQSKGILRQQETNEKVLEFTQLFIEKVLKAEGEIDFETRLNLETAVRGLKDSEILAQWNRFIESNSEAQAQEEVKKLLGILVSKIKK